MTTWNYRLVKRLDGFWAVHEVYYDEDGRAQAMTVEPADFTYETKGDVRRALEMAIDDCWNRLPFIEPPQGGWPVTEDYPYGKGLQRKEDESQGQGRQADEADGNGQAPAQADQAEGV